MVKVTTNGNGKILVEAPYHPDFPEAARNLGGRWDGNRWSFDARDEARVRDLLWEIYGEDGQRPVSRVTCRLKLDNYSTNRNAVFFCGRQVVWRPGRDFKVHFGDGVVLLAGGFPASGGSMKRPALAAERGTVLEIRDIPEHLARAEAEKYPEAVEIISEDKPQIDREALLREAEALRARLAEIERLLAETEAQ